MAVPTGQADWRFCSKCYCLWLSGLPTQGSCPAGGEHTQLATAFGGPATPPADPQRGPGSWDYILIADPVISPGPTAQPNWRFCTKCYCLWLSGGATNGSCPAGGEHSPFATDAGPATPPADPQGGPDSWNYILIAEPNPPIIH